MRRLGSGSQWCEGHCWIDIGVVATRARWTALARRLQYSKREYFMTLGISKSACALAVFPWAATLSLAQQPLPEAPQAATIVGTVLDVAGPHGSECDCGFAGTCT